MASAKDGMSIRARSCASILCSGSLAEHVISNMWQQNMWNMGQVATIKFYLGPGIKETCMYVYIYIKQLIHIYIYIYLYTVYYIFIYRSKDISGILYDIVWLFF